MKIQSVLAVAALAFASVAAADHHKEKSAEAKCPVLDRPIDKQFSADYMGGTVYFCCEECVGKFEKSPDKYATKANHQLVVTGQAKQTKCPLTGRNLNPEKTVEVGGVEVEFCCANCEAKVAAAKPDEAIEMVFATKPFKTAYEVKKD